MPKPWEDHQNGKFFKKAMRKSYPPTGFEPAMVIQRLSIQTLQVQILLEDNFFTLLILSSRCVGGSSLGFGAGSL